MNQAAAIRRNNERAFLELEILNLKIKNSRSNHDLLKILDLENRLKQLQ